MSDCLVRIIQIVQVKIYHWKLPIALTIEFSLISAAALLIRLLKIILIKCFQPINDLQADLFAKALSQRRDYWRRLRVGAYFGFLFNKSNA